MNAKLPTGSLYLPRSGHDVRREYAQTAGLPEDHAKAKWGSEASMLGRFRLGFSLVQWDQVGRWLDIGCGTGRFFAEAEGAGLRVDEMVGADLVPELVEQADARPLQGKARFLAADLGDLPEDLGLFDLITLVGVLQQCGLSPKDAMASCAQRLAPDGQIFLTTKNLDWEAFATGRLEPEPGHSWFRHRDIVDAALAQGLEIIRTGGLLPSEDRVVEVEESHTLYLLARRPA